MERKKERNDTANRVKSLCERKKRKEKAFPIDSRVIKTSNFIDSMKESRASKRRLSTRDRRVLTLTALFHFVRRRDTRLLKVAINTWGRLKSQSILFKLSAFPPSFFLLPRELSRKLKERGRKFENPEWENLFIRSICNFKTPRAERGNYFGWERGPDVAEIWKRLRILGVYRENHSWRLVRVPPSRIRNKDSGPIKGARYPPIKLFVSRAIKTN